MDPFTIPAHGEVEIECEARPGEPGPFQCPMYLNYYDGDFQGIRLTVSGTWTPSVSTGHEAGQPK